MTEPGDRDLRERFAVLQREDAAGAPPFEATRAAAVSQRTGRPRLVPWTAPAIVFVAVAALVVLGVLRSPPRREPLVSLATTRWQSPTDFLLRVPGAEYLETIPGLTPSFPQLADWRNP